MPLQLLWPNFKENYILELLFVLSKAFTLSWPYQNKVIAQRWQPKGLAKF